MGAIVVAILSALAGFLVWIAQRYYERRADERLRKEELYGKLLTASIEFISTGNAAPFVVESQKAWLYASDEVLKRISDYLKAFRTYAKQEGEAKTEAAWAAVEVAEGRLRLSIRKDLQSKTAITPQWVATEWEMITSRPERIERYLKRGSDWTNERTTVKGEEESRADS